MPMVGQRSTLDTEGTKKEFGDLWGLIAGDDGHEICDAGLLIFLQYEDPQHLSHHRALNNQANP